MKKLIFAVSVSFALAACGDDNGSSANELGSEISSSSVENVSSSDKVAESSSSVVTAKSLFCKTETEDNCEYGSLIDDRDGKTYKTVHIGNQWWMAQNLVYADSNKTESLKGNVLCLLNETENCAKGLLYTWNAANEACPEGWHLPSVEDWKTLIDTVGGESVAGKILKSQTGWVEGNNGSNGTDAVGFSIVPLGWKQRAVFSLTVNGFWSAAEVNAGKSSVFVLSNMDDGARIGSGQEISSGFPVRCVRN